jgi:hypothetical protein
MQGNGDVFDVVPMSFRNNFLKGIDNVRVIHKVKIL